VCHIGVVNKGKHMTFAELVEQKTQRILDEKGGTPGRQSIATTRGQQVEVAAAELLRQHPNVKSVETQVFYEDLDEFSNIDLVVNTKDGRRVYIPVARDLWLGTSQQDRLQVVWEKYKRGVFNDHEVHYLTLSDPQEFVDAPVMRHARRKVKLQEVVSTLHDANVIVTFAELTDLL
jgi:hypothetical protein